MSHVPGPVAWRAPLGMLGFATSGAVLADFMPAVPALIVRAIIGAVAVAAVCYGVRRHHARPPIVWWLIAGGIGVWVVGDTLWDTFDVVLANSDSNWYVLPNVLYLATYPALVWAIVKLVAAQGHPGGVEQVLDTFIPALLVLLVVRAFVVDPSFSGSTLDALFNGAYPLGDALLVAGVAWLLFTPGMGSASAWLLASGTVMMLGTDVIWDLAERFAPGTWDWLISPLYPVSYAVLAAAALHPSVGSTAESRQAAGRDGHTARLVLLCCALGLLPVVIFAADRRDALVVILTVAMVIALGVRFVALVRALQSAEREAARSARRFSSLIASVPVGILEADPDARIIFSNHAIDTMLGRSAVGLTDEQLIEQFVDERDHVAVREAFAAVVAGRSAAAQMRMRDTDGVERWIAWYGAPVQDGSGRFAGAFSSTIEITPLKVAEKTLAQQATHDPLTGLPNRRLLHDRLSTALGRLGRQHGMIAVLFLDLDGFKSVNDLSGHDAGDELLRVVATRLRHCVRTEDAVARFGGDEFVVVLERIRDRADAAFVAGKVVKAIAAPVKLNRGHRTVQVGASVGVAVSTSASDDPDALLRDADVAMFEAKRAGRGTYRFFEQHVVEDRGAAQRGEVRSHT